MSPRLSILTSRDWRRGKGEGEGEERRKKERVGERGKEDGGEIKGEERRKRERVGEREGGEEREGRRREGRLRYIHIIQCTCTNQYLNGKPGMLFVK